MPGVQGDGAAERAGQKEPAGQAVTAPDEAGQNEPAGHGSVGAEIFLINALLSTSLCVSATYMTPDEYPIATGLSNVAVFAGPSAAPAAPVPASV